MIGGLFGGFEFIVILIAIGAILKNYIKVCFLDFFHLLWDINSKMVHNIIMNYTCVFVFACQDILTIYFKNV